MGKFEKTEGKLERSIQIFPDIIANKLKKIAAEIDVLESVSDIIQAVNSQKTGNPKPNRNGRKPVLSASRLAWIVWDALPLGILFREDAGDLPNHVNLNLDGQPEGAGADAARNFLLIAGIDIAQLMTLDKRSRANKINLANSKISREFASFWSQTIGHKGKLSLKFDFDYFDRNNSTLAGHPYLTFWTSDEQTQLYPKQRSKGVRWFISVFLQLGAAKIDGLDRIFLLDEPGANLHSNAQADALRFLNQLASEKTAILYSTHSPQLIEYDKLYRIHAVQRSAETEDSATVLINAHRLGTASTDTLSPILNAMGADLSHQQIIKKRDNVLLEEMSGFYYLKSFWKLMAISSEVNFIAATGVNKIEALANMFIGWGLEFIVAVDDDKQGRLALQSMKKNFFGDNEILSAKRLLKIPDCPGIEDSFSQSDFKKYVLRNIEEVSGTNSQHMKDFGKSKPIHAYKFALLVETGELTFYQLDEESQQKIAKITSSILSLLEQYDR